MKLYLFSICSLLLLVVSCREDHTPVQMGYDYFPTQEGKYVVYQVMEVRHDTDLQPTHDTSNYYLKEVVGEPFTDEAGDTAHKLYRYIGETQQNLSLKDVWIIKRTPANAQKVEENIRIVKLGFAPDITDEWDGNAMNNNDEELYTYEWVHEPYTVGNIALDSNVKVLQQDFYTFVDYLSAYEVYGKNVGLIHKVKKDFYISNFDTINVIRGTEIEMRAIEYGIEPN